MRIFFLSLFSFAVFSCQTEPFKRGLHPDYDFYLAANVVFLPSVSLEEDLSSSEDLKKLFKTLDEEILSNFVNQAFIHGFGQRLVEKTFEEEKNKNLRESLTAFLQRKNDSSSFLKFYRENLQDKPEWLLFLKDLSRVFSFSDSVFLPVVTKVTEKQKNDRGLQVSARSLALSLILIEVESGHPIWYEKRELTLSEKHFPSPPAFVYPEYPSWKNFEKKLIVKSLWKNFPGWQY